jgi:anti-sigma B factor antagonist
VEINVTTTAEATQVVLIGDIDGSTAPAAQAQILPLAGAGAHILLDMSGVAYMSSAGLRMLLSTYRQLTSKGGKMVLVGLSDDIQDTMSVTGFLKFFTVCATVDEGMTALRQV